MCAKDANNPEGAKRAKKAKRIRLRTSSNVLTTQTAKGVDQRSDNRNINAGAHATFNVVVAIMIIVAMRPQLELIVRLRVVMAIMMVGLV